MQRVVPVPPLRQEKVFGYNKLERQYGLLIILIFSTLFLIIMVAIIYSKFTKTHTNNTINYLNTKLENTKYLTNSYIDTISKTIPYFNVLQ